MVIEPALNSCANPGPIERIVAIATTQTVSRDIMAAVVPGATTKPGCQSTPSRSVVAAWNAVPSPSRPEVQHHGIDHQSRTPHEWSRSPQPSNAMRSSPTSTCPWTAHACS